MGTMKSQLSTGGSSGSRFGLGQTSMWKRLKGQPSRRTVGRTMDQFIRDQSAVYQYAEERKHVSAVIVGIACLALQPSIYACGCLYNVFLSS